MIDANAANDANDANDSKNGITRVVQLIHLGYYKIRFSSCLLRLFLFLFVHFFAFLFFLVFGICYLFFLRFSFSLLLCVHSETECSFLAGEHVTKCLTPFFLFLSHVSRQSFLSYSLVLFSSLLWYCISHIILSSHIVLLFIIHLISMLRRTCDLFNRTPESIVPLSRSHRLTLF